MPFDRDQRVDPTVDIEHAGSQFNQRLDQQSLGNRAG